MSITRFEKIGPLIDIGGIIYPARILYDKFFNRSIAPGYLRKKLAEAQREDYPRLLSDLYKVYTGKELNLQNPTSYNEKIQWLKIYDDSEIKRQLSDKYLVRKWVERKIGKEYLTTLFGIWDSFDEIDFVFLPNSFFLKCNHGSGYNIAVPNKLEINTEIIRKNINDWMACDFAYNALELQYSQIKKKIIAEEYLKQSDGNLLDFKFHVFNSEPRIIQVIGNRNLYNHTARECFLTKEWTLRETYQHTYTRYDNIPQKPGNLNKMLDIARVLGEGFKYVRVDLYNLDGQIKFGEMTFTPAAGYEPWDDEFQELLGSWIDLS